MADWKDIPKSNQSDGNFHLLIDEVHRFLIDDTYLLLIQDGNVGITWNNIPKS